MAINQNFNDPNDPRFDPTQNPEYTDPAGHLKGDLGVPSSEGKNIALIAHLTIIGWIIALVMNNNNKDEFGSFYIRQVLGLGLTALVLSFIPILGWFIGLVVLIFWILSLIGAINGEKKLTPVLGAYYQDWFKSL